MADEISNKTLAILVVAAIVVTLGGTMLVIRQGPSVTLTGLYTTQQGTAAFNVSEVVSIKINQNSINFGEGYVNESDTFCTMDSTGAHTTACDGSWNNPSNAGFIIENNGNVDCQVAINASTASEFVGGTATTPQYNFKSSDKTGETGSCTSGLVSSWTAFSHTGQTICSNLKYQEANDEIRVDVQVTVPNDATPGQHTDTVTFTASST